MVIQRVGMGALTVILLLRQRDLDDAFTFASVGSDLLLQIYYTGHLVVTLTSRTTGNISLTIITTLKLVT